MAPGTSDGFTGQPASARHLGLAVPPQQSRPATSGPARTAVERFGAQIDVRNRGALRLNPSARGAAPAREQPAVVRMWHGEQCRELSVHEARALAAQLVAAALYADQQNMG
jgi:hypothetical protein